MTDWATIASFATAVGTLVLALATFSAVRASNRSVQLSEQALQEQRRPLLVQARLDDPVQKIMFADGYWARVEGSQAAVEEKNGAIYFVVALRNVGAGIAVMQGWYPWPEQVLSAVDHRDPAEFRSHTRDLYIAPGDVGLWQGALRDADEEVFARLSVTLAERQSFSVDLLYTDQVGGQRTISRLGVTPTGDDRWVASVARHWHLDHLGPR
ncbi:MAG TPA: hypothetical protein VHS52_05025 [Acidimicrobiales bacterium]|jgi:hypothetical protein|nr:hypothetical protein [Acidimicrobiales bacterium]